MTAHASVSAPLAEKKPTERTHHGDTVTDNYEWLRGKEDAEVIAHLEAENAYTDARTAHLEPLRETIFGEIKARVQETDLSVPVREGQWWYYGRTLEGQQYGIQCRAPISGAEDWTPPKLSAHEPVAGEQVLLDCNLDAEGTDFYSLGSFDVSDDGTRLLWGTDVRGDERYTVRVKSLESGELFDDVIENTMGAFFAPDGKSILYTTVDDAWRPDTLWLHVLGTPTSDDVKLFHEPDERYWLGAGLTRSRKYLVISVGSKITSEERFVLADDLTAVPTLIWPRREGVEYSADHAVIGGEDAFVIVHNDGAIDFQVDVVSVADPQGERRTLVPHVAGTRINDVDCFSSVAGLEYRDGGITKIDLIDYVSGRRTPIRFDEELYSAGLGGNPEFNPPFLRLGFGSFITPSSVYNYELATGELTLLKQQPVLGGYEASDYGQRREWAQADDGTKVPISLVWKKSFGEPGEKPRPLHLYGYGSYEISIDPAFSIPRLSELDRGVIFAVAHVRGGGEMGREWYDHGKLNEKKNTFSDFVAAGFHLSDTGITTPDQLVAEGGSAGGLLMGAALNLAPNLFAGVLANVPFVDSLTTILDPSLPLTVIEWDEWGDPLHNADVYEYMKSYSPYENIRDGIRYPRVLAVTSLNDTRVEYVEPAKWVARLREAGANDVLLKCEMVAGHGGVSGRYNSWKERAFELSWMFDVWGLTK